MLDISVLIMKGLYTTVSAIFIYFVYSLLPKDLTIRDLIISTSFGVMPCDDRETSPRIS